MYIKENMNTKSYLFITVATLGLAACGSDNTTNQSGTPIAKTSTGSTNTLASGPKNTSEVMRGRTVFKENCQTCHGEKAVGQVKNWREPLPNGKYPAPPLDGTGHAWHHPGAALLKTINMGGIAIGGTMPPFKDVLSDKDKRAALSYIQSLWPEKTYQMWLKKNGGK